MKGKRTEIGTVGQRIFIYLSVVFGAYYITWLAAILLPEDIGQLIYSILSFPVVFMGIPALAVLITRKITKDKSSLKYSPKVWENKKMLLFSAIVPTAAVFIGAIIFYLIFPNDLDYSGSYISQTYGAFGAPAKINFTLTSFFILGAVAFLISVICVPSWFMALGEDIGWQGYLLPLLCKKMPVIYAVVLNGALWGLGHAPLIYFGMNYGLDYAGAPFTGIIMMVFFCMVIGVWMSYVTLKTNNCMYAAIIHGSVNIIGETPVFISLLTQSSLLGPNPIGIISMIILLMGAGVLLLKLPQCKQNESTN